MQWGFKYIRAIDSNVFSWLFSRITYLRGTRDHGPVTTVHQRWRLCEFDLWPSTAKRSKVRRGHLYVYHSIAPTHGAELYTAGVMWVTIMYSLLLVMVCFKLFQSISFLVLGSILKSVVISRKFCTIDINHNYVNRDKRPQNTDWRTGVWFGSITPLYYTTPLMACTINYHKWNEKWTKYNHTLLLRYFLSSFPAILFIVIFRIFTFFKIHIPSCSISAQFIYFIFILICTKSLFLWFWIGYCYL